MTNDFFSLFKHDIVQSTKKKQCYSVAAKPGRLVNMYSLKQLKLVILYNKCFRI